MTKLSISSVSALVLILLLLFLLGCRQESTSESEPGMEIEGLYGRVPNPASVYCEEQGYKTELRTDSLGSQHEVCIFPDESECKSWDFLKGKCGQTFSFCETKGFKIENRVKDMGSWRAEYAVCVFPDRSECLEWKFFKEECQPGLLEDE